MPPAAVECHPGLGRRPACACLNSSAGSRALCVGGCGRGRRRAGRRRHPSGRFSSTHLREAGLGALTDLGFVGLDDDPDDPVIVTGRRATRGHPLTDAQKEANRLVSRERAANEHGFTDLKNWRILTKVRMNARHATTLLRALLVLTNAEVHR
ncbi:transposase family protein [Streptomyces sp. CA-179760]|uniref:transposase family protein n=1 Tax=Streptomyces sp. CA-179760 TaxID=3240054 RepID=UPI003D8A5B07